MTTLQEMPGSVDQSPPHSLVNDYETSYTVSSQQTSPTDSPYQLPTTGVTNCPTTAKSHVTTDNTSPSDCTFTGYMQLSSTPAHYERLERSVYGRCFAVSLILFDTVHSKNDNNNNNLENNNNE